MQGKNPAPIQESGQNPSQQKQKHYFSIINTSNTLIYSFKNKPYGLREKRHSSKYSEETELKVDKREKKKDTIFRLWAAFKNFCTVLSSPSRKKFPFFPFKFEFLVLLLFKVEAVMYCTLTWAFKKTKKKERERGKTRSGSRGRVNETEKEKEMGYLKEVKRIA